MKTTPPNANRHDPKQAAVNKRPYRPPTVVPLGKVEVLTRGMGHTFTDYLGDITTRYG